MLFEYSRSDIQVIVSDIVSFKKVEKVRIISIKKNELRKYPLNFEGKHLKI